MDRALNVLIAEDDLMLADLLEEILVDLGHNVCGISRTVDEAVAIGLASRPDLAIIDVRLADGGLGPHVALALSGLTGMAVLYATGNLDQALLLQARGHGCIVKPYRAEDMVRSVEIVSEMVSTGMATGPVPRNFRFLPSGAPKDAPLAHG